VLNSLLSQLRDDDQSKGCEIKKVQQEYTLLETKIDINLSSIPYWFFLLQLFVLITTLIIERNEVWKNSKFFRKKKKIKK